MEKNNKMGTWSIPRLLYSMSLPAIFSMFVQSLYNIVDTIYISRVTEESLFVIGIVFPLQTIVISLAIGGAVGASSLIARRLGERNRVEAGKVAYTGLWLVFFHYLISAFIGLFLSTAFLKFFTMDQNHLLLGHQYLSIIMGGSFGMFFSIYYEKLFQAQGNMLVPMFKLLLGACLNIILDPILIFGWFNFPRLGIKGAALATVIAQVIALIFIVLTYHGKCREVCLVKTKLNYQRIKSIYAVALPVSLMNIIGSLATTLLNGILVNFSQLAVTTYTLYFKIQGFVFMPVFGMGQGALPILAYNYGAKNKLRYFSCIKYYFFSSLGLMALGTILFYTQSELIIQIFNPSSELLSMASSALKILSLSFVFITAPIVMNTVFQSLGNGLASMLMSILRQLIFLVPATYFLGLIWGIDGIWYGSLIAYLAVNIFFIPYCLYFVRLKFKK